MLIKVTVAGLTPLMMDRFHNGLLEGPAFRTANQRTEPTPLQQAKARLYFENDDEKKPYVPTDYVIKAIIDAGRFIKVGKRQLSTRDETIVPSFLTVIDPLLPIVSKEGWRVDARGIVNQVNKARVMAYRPIFDDWQLTFTLDLDDKEGKPEVARELVDKAGRNIGIGVMRPSRKGRYGQWKVTHWQEQKKEQPHERIATVRSAA